MAENTKEVAIDLSPAIKVYKDGTVERIFGSPIVPPSLDDPITGVSSKDIAISPEVSARLYLPKLIKDDDSNNNQKLPIFVYYHGGAFCLESAFSFLHHRYMNIVSSEANSVVVSVEYRLAPEHPLPVGYEDSWTALRWVASHAVDNTNIEKDPWLINYGNFDRIFIGGDSAGGNIAHNLAMRAPIESLPCDVKIRGAILAHPYFGGSKPVGSMSSETYENSLEYKLWPFVYPSAIGGMDNPMINPFADNAPSLSGLGFSRLFICTAETDPLRDRILFYLEAVKGSGWRGEIEVVDVEGEGHTFQIYDPDSQKAKDLIKRLACFLMQ